VSIGGVQSSRSATSESTGCLTTCAPNSRDSGTSTPKAMSR
jgi:hypothetical protein